MCLKKNSQQVMMKKAQHQGISKYQSQQGMLAQSILSFVELKD